MKLDIFVIVSLNDILIYNEKKNHVVIIQLVLNQQKQHFLLSTKRKVVFIKTKYDLSACDVFMK